MSNQININKIHINLSTQMRVRIKIMDFKMEIAQIESNKRNRCFSRGEILKAIVAGNKTSKTEGFQRLRRKGSAPRRKLKYGWRTRKDISKTR